MKITKNDLIAAACIENLRIPVKKGMPINAMSFNDQLYDHLSLVYDISDRGRLWKILTDGLEECEWIINVFDNNFIVTDRWGK